MKKLANIILSVLLILSLLIPTILYVPITVYASEDNNDLYPYFDNNNKATHKLTELIQLLYMQGCAGVTGDIENYRDCSEEIDKLFNYEYAKGQFVKNSDGGLTVKSDYINTLISGIKNGTQQKYGYTLRKTVPLSRVSALYFTKSAQYKTLCNLIDKNGGIIGIYIYGGYLPMYFKVDTDVFYIKRETPISVTDSSGKHYFYGIYHCKNLNEYNVSYIGKSLMNDDVSADSWDSDNLAVRRNEFYSTFQLYDCFSYYANRGTSTNPLTSSPYLVTRSGCSIPVFNTANDAVAYSVEKGGYFVGSKDSENISDITINVKQLDNLDFYSKLITDLYEQIKNSDFDYDEIANMVDKLSDEINQGLDEVKHEQQIGNTWLEKIYNAIIDLPNKITHSDNNSNDIDLTELNKSLTTVINKLDTINSKLNNIDTDNDNEKLTDIETAIIDNKAVLNTIKTELTSQSVDIKEISTQLQSVADNLKDLSSDVDTINTELINVSNQLDNISKSLNDLAVTLENIEKELKDTNGLLADIKDTLKAIKNWLVADTIFDGIDLISDLAEFINEFMSDIDTGIATISSGLSEVAETFTKKFPFSIPWDILFLIEFLADTPAVPVFELPLKFDSFGINEIIKIDFSRFEIISKISRLLLTMLFTLGLAKFTYNIISVKQGDN